VGGGPTTSATGNKRQPTAAPKCRGGNAEGGRDERERGGRRPQPRAKGGAKARAQRPTATATRSAAARDADKRQRGRRRQRGHGQPSWARYSSRFACRHARGTREEAFSRSTAPLPRPGSTVVRTADHSGATKPPSHRNGWSESEQLGDPGPRAGPSRAPKTRAANFRGTLQMRTAVRQLTVKMLHGPRSFCRRPAQSRAREMGAHVGPVAGSFLSSDWRNGRHGCEKGPFVPCRECVAAWKRRVWRPLWLVVIPRRKNEGSPGPGCGHPCCSRLRRSGGFANQR